MSAAALRPAQLKELGVICYVPRSAWQERRAMAETQLKFLTERAQSGDATLLPAPGRQSAGLALRPSASSGAHRTATRPDTRSAPARTVQARSSPERSELVVPAAEFKRFQNSKMALHLSLALSNEPLPIVENSVLSETALWFEPASGTEASPPALRLGAWSVLRTSARARRTAWLAIRLWRKQQGAR